jgi:hypothetical protein
MAWPRAMPKRSRYNSQYFGIRNLWPQPISDARQKDRVENVLHVQVCAGKISLAKAQKQIAKNWRAVKLPSSGSEK